MTRNELRVLGLLYLMRGQSVLYTVNDWRKPLIVLGSGVDGAVSEGVWNPDRPEG